MNETTNRAYLGVRLLFKISLIVCFILGTLLVLGQLAGVLAARPAWIEGSEALFFVPTIAAAATFGLFGFIGGYLAPAQAGTDDSD
ncbi:hypothetical protein [Nocardiopsis ansamitocini]|uniref:Uncharacterized protein n=1 Tax=Nocardiopsis ansamitocini TaxID=1670832 RepID=A0A9W6UIU7_9ACTN|nr:hypothetical protein [Nocardiopsis ansamitocini]GLU47808.1 hypothetical protein Nans01_21590 [Nocardiopsis ansamitocini]